MFAEAPWSESAAQTAERLEVNPGAGLDEREVARRQADHGPNEMRATRPRSSLMIFAAQFRGVLVALLVIATIVALLFGEWLEGASVAVVLLINAGLGFWTELRAQRSMEALRVLGQRIANVRRDGHLQQVPAIDLVPGDVVVLEGGDVVTADARLIEAHRLQADESLLTGESVPVDKEIDAIAQDAPVSDRTNMLFKGTSIARGSAEAIVVAIGAETEIGRISRLVQDASEETTPLERRLNKLGQRLVWVTLAISGFVAAVALSAGKSLFLALETAIALAIATVPEGLPIIATIALARGMHRMARRNALVNRLSAVETLGATSVLCADKTGTLTENRMTVTRVALADGTFEIGSSQPQATPEGLREALQIGALCNNASIEKDHAVGDPLELALLRAAESLHLDRSSLLARAPEIGEFAFDPEIKMMATAHDRGNECYIAVKGAPESVLAASTRTARGTPLSGIDRAEWLRRAEAMAARGLRLIAVASRTTPTLPQAPYEDLAFVGLLGLKDPPRADAREAIAHYRRAGVRVVMVTGDHPATAFDIARAVGITTRDRDAVVLGSDLDDLSGASDAAVRRLLSADVFARVTPRQKLELIRLHQEHGAIVAMTGDGVNDAPALSKADIGVAMGRRGTDVAKEASELVLGDDSLATIAYAIGQGRVIFENIRTFVRYLLSCNLSEILVIGLATAVGAPLPLLPLQILFLNFVTDVFPALALGAGEGDDSVMRRTPRPAHEQVITKQQWRMIAIFGAIITAATLGAFAIALGPLALSTDQAITIAFLTLAMAQIWHVFDMRRADSSPWKNEVTRNRWVWIAAAGCLALIGAAVYVPGLATVLHVVPPTANGWLLAVAASMAPAVVIQLGMVAHRRARLLTRRALAGAHPLASTTEQPSTGGDHDHLQEHSRRDRSIS